MIDFSKLSIHIIDDDKLFVMRLSNSLRKYTDQITTSLTAENGLTFISKIKPNIIFLDNQLPLQNGIDVIELYKNTSPDSKIILISAFFDVKDVALAIQNKADYIFEKEKLRSEEIKSLFEAIIKSEQEKRSIWRILKIFESNKKNAKNVIVAEDDELFSFHLCWKLDQLAGKLNVSSFSSGKILINKIKEIKPDVIFLDYNLPEVTCQDIMIEIRKKAPNAKIIIISSQENATVALNLKILGVYGYIVKNSNWKLKVDEYIKELGL